MTQRLRYAEIAPEGLAPLHASEHYLNARSSIPAPMLELTRLRCSLLNGCVFCIHMHTQELRKHHEPESRIVAVALDPTGNAFTPRERAALRWAEVVTLVSQTHASEEEYNAVKDFFSATELVDLTLAIASINAWNRLAIPFRAEWKGPRLFDVDEQYSGGPVRVLPKRERGGAVPQSEAEEPTRDAVDDDGSKVAED
jgi:AhpD family alkylhydroperoxidase